jgi:arylsulfatase A
MRFTQCYVQPLCTPTRVQLMTGWSNVRNYVRFGYLDPAARTFAHAFREAGYATAIAGKWQLGADPELPRKVGFGDACLWQHTRRPPRYANPGLEFNGVETNYHRGEYGPDLVNEYAISFILRHRERPFLLYYPMMLTHTPYQPTPDSKTWDPTAQGEKVLQAKEHFKDMVEYMDKLIGKLIVTLESAGLREKTLVLFLGDNGTGRGTVSSLGPEKVVGGKGSTTGAGMHVPLIVSWPGTITAGRVCSDLVDSTDFFPTLLETAGLPLPGAPLDGRSFLPQLRGEKGNPRSWVYTWYSPRQQNLTVREFVFNQRYKLYRSGEFYDLQADPVEARPIAAPELSEEQAAAARVFRRVLDTYQDARPRALDREYEDFLRRKRPPTSDN